MNQFDAKLYTEVSSLMALLLTGQPSMIKDHGRLTTIVSSIQTHCERIALNCTARAAARFVADLERGLSKEIICDRMATMRDEFSAEIANHLFFWVPSERAGWHTKTGIDILGAECVARFQKAEIAREATHAGRCYAYGEWTACAFHLMRICEAGVRALAYAIGHPIDQTKNWGKFFKEFDRQSAVDPRNRTGVWLSHGEFLDSAGGNMRAVKNAWRNETMHLESSYDEQEARHLLEVIPALMGHLASRMDEDGKLYP